MAMKKICFATAAAGAALFAAMPAHAQSVEVSVSAQVDEACFFDRGVNPTIQLSNDQTSGDLALGFVCNFDGAAQISVTSLNGGLMPDTSEEPVPAFAYSLSVGPLSGPASDFAEGGPLAGPQTFGNVTSIVPVPVPVFVSFKAVGLPAGNYSDTVAISIAP
ncbi:hypothetical protein [Stakelama tenebrarum]|uniref:Spore coat protein U domain-containing protein n=1 Tax=Stakelama tenebrarum TaxID=2711215 RepID=A0A6G6Y2B6_9SPHN|nr:hypothetical protein [Sphingosinithalassobacter tenebrarum]QIG79039.1 hypothetical protein G5C33_04070 [Sphingosinithalassobacter tenebrarum]